MGYCHHFAYQPHHPEFISGWPQLTADAELIIAACARRGVRLGPGVEGYQGKTAPEANERWIWLNGAPWGRLEHETLLILGPGKEAEECVKQMADWFGKVSFVWASVKTQRKPYDLAVTAILLRARLLMPQAFGLSSDGAWAGEWGTARDLVAELFGASPVESPFTPSAFPPACAHEQAYPLELISPPDE